MKNLATAIKSAPKNETAPIVMASVFKSGTWLLRFIIARLTGLDYHEPPIETGTMDPGDPNLITVKAGHFYSWHLSPSPPVQKKLMEINAKPVFLMRNIYDLVVSMYYHFSNNIDHEIGRGANKHNYFSHLGKDSAIQKIITGCDGKEFKWRGLAPHLQQMEHMFKFANIFPCHLVSYDGLVNNKEKNIQELAGFFNMALSPDNLDELVHSSGFDAMKSAALKQNRASHFRQGKTRSHIQELDRKHIQAIEECLEKHAPNLALLATSKGFSGLLENAVA